MKTIILTPEPAPEPASKDRVLTYLYKTYPEDCEVIKKYIVAIENVPPAQDSETQWDYFINPDSSLHTDLVEEDFNYYKNYMYPDQLYDA